VRARALVALVPLTLALVAAPGAAARDSQVAALQVALRAKGLYKGDVDGLAGPLTAKAIRRLQKRAGLEVDGVVGPKTRRALGKLARPKLGRRVLELGREGGDVAQLQFMLGLHGFPGGPIDGIFGSRTDASLRRFQEWAGLRVDGKAGPATLSALAQPPPVSPIRLAPPMPGPYTDGFGPRGDRFHAGLDYPADAGAPVRAAGNGQVSFTGWFDGYGYIVAIVHAASVRTLYAHLSRIDVRLGQKVRAGAVIGAVGATGIATGPHLHFEVRLRGAAVDPLTAVG
jgi:murein DD-endopeptidase MepM/ murein hydrolase activator NlpD